MRGKSRQLIAVATAVFLLHTVFSAHSANQDSLSDVSLFTKGCAAFEDGLYSLAERCFVQHLAKAGAESKDRDQVVHLLFRTLYHQKKLDDIQKLIKEEKSRSANLKDSGSILFWDAAALYGKGKHKESISVLDKFEDKHSASKYAPKVEQLRIRSFLELGHKKAAIQACQRFDENYPDDPEVQENLLIWGKLLFDDGDAAKAAVVLTRLAKLSADNMNVHNGQYWLGRTLVTAGSSDRAVEVLTALSSNTNAVSELRASAYFLMADVYQKTKKDEAAAVALKSGLNLAQKGELKQNAGLRLGMLLLEMNHIKEGIPLLKSYISASPGNPAAAAAQLHLAEVLVESGDSEAAVGEFQQYLETFTNSVGRAEASKGKGWALMNIERFAEAATAFTKAFDLYEVQKEKEYCLFKVGDAQFANAQYKLASETYSALISDFPESSLVPAAFFQLGDSFVKSDLTEKAEESFVQLSQKYPTSPLAEEAFLRIAQMKADKGLTKDAIGEFTSLMEKYPSGNFYADALHGRGIAYYKQWRFAEALKDFDSIVSKHASSKVAETAYFKRGICHYWLGRDKQALSICKDFLGKYPDSKWAGDVTFWIAKFEFNQEHFEEAEKNFIKFADKYKDHSLADDALLRAGLAASGRNEFVLSIEHLTRMVKDYPKSKKIAEARFAQGDALRQLAKFSAAILVFDELINKYAESELINPAWLSKGDCQFSLGAEDPARYKEAIGSYRVVANSSTANMGLVLKAEYMIGRCLEKLGRSVEAFEEQYYPKVMIRFFKCRKEGIWLNQSAKTWFVRSAFNSADILEAKGDWRGVVKILDRVVESGVYAAEEAQERIKKIKSEHFWLFYQ